MSALEGTVLSLALRQHVLAKTAGELSGEYIFTSASGRENKKA
jgi:hypothetical protein